MKYAIGQKALLACLHLAVLAVPAAASTIYLPQIAVGTAGDLEIRTLITISNPVSNPNYATTFLIAYGNDGSYWTVDWEARDRPDLSKTDFALSWTLGHGQSVTLLLKSTGPLAIGWIGGRSDVPVVITLRYSVARVTGGAIDPQWEVGVLPSAGMNEHFLFVAEGASDWNGCITSTALAIANTAEDAAASLTLELFAYGGGNNPIHTRNITVPARGHLAQFLPEIFDGVFSATAFRGMLRISSNTAVAVTTLQNWVSGSDSVYAAAAALPYQSALANLSFDREPNTYGEGEYIQAPAEVVGVLNSSTDEADTDWFRMYIDVPGTLAVVSLGGVLGSALTPEMTLLGQDGQTVLGNSATFLQGFGASSFQVAIPQAGTYWLRVSSPSSDHGRQLFYRIFMGFKQ